MAKAKRQVTSGNIYIQSSFNNTIATVTDTTGAVLSWSSSGKSGFKGTRKATPFAATTAVEKAVREAQEKHGLSEVSVFIKGPGAGRDAGLRAIKAVGLRVRSIADVTPFPHNGPRPKKKRRV